MAKAATYLKDIRAQVKTSHGGKVPEYLNLTIRRYAAALELQDYYTSKMQSDGPVIYEKGSTGNLVRKQHPLCNLIYQQENLCQQYAKMLGLTSAKAAVKPEEPRTKDAKSKLDDYIDATIG